MSTSWAAARPSWTVSYTHLDVYKRQVPILTAPLVGGGVLEVEVLLDVVGSELNTGLLVGDRALRADTHRCV